MGGCEQLGIFLNSGQTKASQKTEQMSKFDRDTLHKRLKCVLENQGNTENQQCARLRPNQTVEENSGANS